MSRFIGFSRGDRLSLYRIQRDTLTQYVETQYPPQWRKVRLLGSCRSTVCIYNVATREVALWDPFTANGHRVLPAADNRPLELGLSFGVYNPDRRQVSRLGLVTSVYVFGFDERNAEYVLLRVVQTESRATSNFATVSLYRERDNMWRPLDPQGRRYFLAEPGRMGVCLRDRLYWLMRRGREQDSAIVLVAFDISTNSFVDVDLPNDIDNLRRMDLARLGGHLCLIIYGPQSLDVRIKRYNGSEQPWEQLFSLNESFQSVQPLAYFQDDLNRVLVELSRTPGSLGCYNLLTNQLQLIDMPRIFDEATYLLLGF